MLGEMNIGGASRLRGLCERAQGCSRSWSRRPGSGAGGWNVDFLGSRSLSALGLGFLLNRNVGLGCGPPARGSSFGAFKDGAYAIGARLCDGYVTGGWPG